MRFAIRFEAYPGAPSLSQSFADWESCFLPFGCLYFTVNSVLLNKFWKSSKVKFIISHSSIKCVKITGISFSVHLKSMKKKKRKCTNFWNSSRFVKFYRFSKMYIGLSVPKLNQPRSDSHCRIAHWKLELASVNTEVRTNAKEKTLEQKKAREERKAEQKKAASVNTEATTKQRQSAPLQQNNMCFYWFPLISIIFLDLQKLRESVDILMFSDF